MFERPLLVSCAFFGFRSDRDTYAYYVPQLLELARQWPEPIMLFTNDREPFGSRFSYGQYANHLEYMQMLWDEPNWETIYQRNLAWHPKNAGLSQARNSKLASVWLSKIGMMAEAAHQGRDLLWIDAGLLNSVCRRGIPGPEPAAYRSDIADGLLMRLISVAKSSRKPLMATIQREFRLFKNHKPNFHGLSYFDMARLARRFSAKADLRYVVGGAMYVPNEHAATFMLEGREIWRAILEMDRAGTEENIFSVLRWKHQWPSRSLCDWVQSITDEPIQMR